MVRKERKRISYVLPLANSAGGHRLGVNGLAVDAYNSILYSGGRDGVICAWDLNLDLQNHHDDAAQAPLASSAPSADKVASSTTFRQQVQAHTHWINDIVLAQSNQALVSASSDITVKVWRPGAQDVRPPQTIGLHRDYVKCLASPGAHTNWVASGGLDRKILLWDLDGAGQKLKIDVGEEENTAKGSVYALAVTPTVLASGGPESIVRVWDPRSGKRITKFVGHTDNIRDVLIAQDGETIMTASSDQTVKVWSMNAGRCMYTLTMHNDSVWSLYSDHPRLSVFYSSDRSGLVAKNDTRGCAEMDEGLSVAICREHEGVTKVVSAGDYIWTATSSSSINRWNDVDTEAEVQLPESFTFHLPSAGTTGAANKRYSLIPQRSEAPPTEVPRSKQIPYKCTLRLSNATPFPVLKNRDPEATTAYSAASIRKASDAILEADLGGVQCYRSLPDHSIEGQHGLIKHVLLNDRRRVLTLDTAGEVTLWDLLKCAPVRSFGKRHLDDVLPKINTVETVAHWCSVDTRTGSLTCVLEENSCFDAEMYADEVDLEEQIDFREDQRINLGKWILRYLFQNLIDEEIKRDEAFRKQLLEEKNQLSQRAVPPTGLSIPAASLTSWIDTSSTPTSASTVRPPNGFQYPVHTPGLAIGVATPGVQSSSTQDVQNPPLPGATEDVQGQHVDHQSTLSDKPGDYFSAVPHPGSPATPGTTTNGEAHDASVSTDKVPQSPTTEQAPGKESMFGKRFRMKSPFGMKNLKITKSTTQDSNKPAAVEDKSEDSDSRSSKTDEKVIEDNFHGAVQRIRMGYEDQVHEGAQTLTLAITPSLPNDTPVIKPPLNTTILIQEDRADSGGVADLFEGKVGNLAQQAELIEKLAPMWLGDVLLRNQIPLKEIVKVSFILEPYQNVLPSIASEGNNRLNANRMLRARKILSYVAERIEAAPEKPDPDALKPEEYLELYCQNQLIAPTMTLATIRTYVWRGGGDVLLYYKANGRKTIQHSLTPPVADDKSGTTASGSGSSSVHGDERKNSSEAQT